MLRFKSLSYNIFLYQNLRPQQGSFAPRLPALPVLGGGRKESDGGGRAVTVRGKSEPASNRLERGVALSVGPPEAHAGREAEGPGRTASMGTATVSNSSPANLQSSQPRSDQEE